MSMNISSIIFNATLRYSCRCLITILYEAQKINLIEDLLLIVTIMPYSSPTKLQWYGTYMRERYILAGSSISPYSLEWPPAMTEKVFELSLIEKGAPPSSSRSPIKLKNILNCGGRRQVVLIEGVPGSGKTTLSQYICKSWSNGELFQEYEVIILVQVRDPALHSAKTIADLLPCRDTVMADRAAAEITANDGKGVLWIFEGWDELPKDLQIKSIMKDIIILPSESPVSKSDVIITFRPIPNSVLYRKTRYSRRIEVIGFSKHELNAYFEEYLKEKPVKVIKDLMRALEERPYLKESCYIPLNATIVAYIYQYKNFTLPETLYEMFSTLICVYVLRHVQKNDRYDNVESIEAFEDIPDELKPGFKEICKLAYDGIMEKKVAFAAKNLPPHFETFGVLHVVESFAMVGRSSSYHFLHLTFQELLAAYFISTELPQDQQVSKFREMFDKPRFMVTFQFYAAITKLRISGFPAVVGKIVSPYYNHSVAPLLNCAYEAQDQDLCSYIAQHLKDRKLKLEYVELSPTDCLCIGYFLSNACSNVESCLLEVDLSFVYIGDEGLECLLQNLHFSSNSAKLDMTLPAYQFRDSGLHTLSQFLQNKDSKMLKSLILGHPKSHGQGRFLSSENLTDSESKVDMLKHLALSLVNNHHLHELSLINCNLTMTSDNGPMVEKMLQVNKVLKVLILAKNPRIGDIGVAFIAKGLQSNLGLIRLNLSHCGITSKGAQKLALALTDNQTLQALNIQDNKLSDEGITCIANALKTNKSLTCLNLADCGMTDIGLDELGASLVQNESIKILHIGFRDYTNDECYPRSNWQDDLTHITEPPTSGWWFHRHPHRDIRITVKISDKGMRELASHLQVRVERLDVLGISRNIAYPNTVSELKRVTAKVEILPPKFVYLSPLTSIRYLCLRNGQEGDSSLTGDDNATEYIY